MARQTDILLGANAWSSGNDKNPQLDPKYGGQFGWALEPAEWLSAQAHLPRHLIPIVLETPRFFELMPNKNYWVQAWKVFFEKHARVIEGLKAGTTVDVVEHNFGGAGEMFQEFADVKRERSTLSVTTVEKYGNVWQNFWERVIHYGMMDPETKTPLTATLQGDGPSDNLSDWYSGTIAFIEPDPTGRRCHRAWIGVNIWPHNNGPIEGKMDKNSALSIKDLSLEFSITAFTGHGIRAYGQELLDGVNKTWANPQLRKSFIQEIHPDILAQTKGYKQSTEDVGTQRVADII